MSKIIDVFRLKKLDFYVFKQFLFPFLGTFFVAWFVLIMQFLWKYIDDMIGKGIETSAIIKLFSYASASLIPMSLPLAMLLSSIMVMGRFGENSEITAAKASGISILRYFRGAILFSVLVSVFAFFYSNKIYTKTQAVYRSMLSDVRQLKPAMIIKPKTFYNGISGVSIRVESKNDSTGEMQNLKIYNHSGNKGNLQLIIAKRGIMNQSEDGNILIMKLDSGEIYQEYASNSFDNPKFPFYKTYFNRYEKRFDLSQFKLKTEETASMDEVRLTYTISKLNHVIDSMKQDIKQDKLELDSSFGKDYMVYATSEKTKQKIDINQEVKKLSKADFLKIKLILVNKIRNRKNAIFMYNNDYIYKKNNLSLFNMEWHRKFTLAISCLVLFFVGAPLGAIIKKGGIGLPMFLSVILFILFYVTSLIGDKLAMNYVVPAWAGMWASTLVFLPFGFFLTYKVTNDSSWTNIEAIISKVKDMAAKRFSK